MCKVMILGKEGEFGNVVGYLIGRGHEVGFLGSGSEMKPDLSRRKADADCIVVDAERTKNLFTELAEIRCWSKKVGLVVVTDRPVDEIDDETFGLDVWAVVGKPVDPEALWRKIDGAYELKRSSETQILNSVRSFEESIQALRVLRSKVRGGGA